MRVVVLESTISFSSAVEEGGGDREEDRERGPLSGISTSERAAIMKSSDQQKTALGDLSCHLCSAESLKRSLGRLKRRSARSHGEGRSHSAAFGTGSYQIPSTL